jgi:hypothetical protein
MAWPEEMQSDCRAVTEHEAHPVATEAARAVLHCHAAAPHGLFTKVLHPALMDDTLVLTPPSHHRGIESAALGSSGDGACHGGDGVGLRRAHHQAWSGPIFGVVRFLG